ncbi:polysaccharide deacetylase [candidate division LCP-89 bacterium B3_LCP]|uniref:Polysaccharide deacetylase n=1 Tax=candidate division LCP-89 bacterium B3_LCP TaxID=2012998 RepID=A0A532V1T8_UNCL8|nr:MAG: polysaccharide deacetylase [candidate division LCP-89 bacterium B3_LCP]
MKNLLTIDLEDYYQTSGMSDLAPIARWSEFEKRIEPNVECVLEVLGDVKATFFVLGWEAQRHPQLIRKIFERGHEIATHGEYHRLITSLSRDEFTSDLKSAIEFLEDTTGDKVLGHRAPSFSITDETPWAFEVMTELGLKYDSSVFPVKRKRGGIEGVQRTPYDINCTTGKITEYPLAVMDFVGRKLPVAGGGFFRIYPYWLTKRAITDLNDKSIPAVVYLHPWELDPQQPKLKSFFDRSGFNQYVGLNSTKKKLKQLLMDFEFTTIKDHLNTKYEKV